MCVGGLFVSACPPPPQHPPSSWKRCWETDKGNGGASRSRGRVSQAHLNRRVNNSFLCAPLFHNPLCRRTRVSETKRNKLQTFPSGALRRVHYVRVTLSSGAAAVRRVDSMQNLISESCLMSFSTLNRSPDGFILHPHFLLSVTRAEKWARREIGRDDARPSRRRPLNSLPRRKNENGADVLQK